MTLSHFGPPGQMGEGLEFVGPRPDPPSPQLAALFKRANTHSNGRRDHAGRDRRAPRLRDPGLNQVRAGVAVPFCRPIEMITVSTQPPLAVRAAI